MFLCQTNSVCLLICHCQSISVSRCLSFCIIQSPSVFFMQSVPVILSLFVCLTQYIFFSISLSVCFCHSVPVSLSLVPCPCQSVLSAQSPLSVSVFRFLLLGLLLLGILWLILRLPFAFHKKKLPHGYSGLRQ